MNKPSIFVFVPLFMALLLSGCSTFQYTSRNVNVVRCDLKTAQQLAGLDVDFSQTVTATSDYQVSRKEAIKEAEFLCLQAAKIDVVVDPVFKFEYNPFRLKARWKATIIGYAGKYKPKTTGVVDAVKEYEMEDIEKYKLLNDPTFPQYYYNKGNGDTYNFGVPSAQNTGKSASIMLQNTSISRNGKVKAPKISDPFKAKQVRDAGISMTSIGAAMTLLIGVPCIVAGYDDAAWASGTAFLTIGCVTAATGIPMWCVGSYQMKHSKENVDVSLGANAQGMGLKLTF